MVSASSAIAPTGSTAVVRRHKRVPAGFNLAVTPTDRCILLAGGTAEHLSAILQCSPSTVRNMRAPSRCAGRMPLHHQDTFRAFAEQKGWILPAGFLTEFRIFEDPRSDKL